MLCLFCYLSSVVIIARTPAIESSAVDSLVDPQYAGGAETPYTSGAPGLGPEGA